MEKVLELASRLGKEIRAHERHRLLREAEKKVLADPDAGKIQDDLGKHLLKIHELERQMKPIEVADKRELSRLQGLARANPRLQELLRVQADYFEMMDKVNSTILGELVVSSGEDAGG